MTNMLMPDETMVVTEEQEESSVLSGSSYDDSSDRFTGMYGAGATLAERRGIPPSSLAESPVSDSIESTAIFIVESAVYGNPSHLSGSSSDALDRQYETERRLGVGGRAITPPDRSAVSDSFATVISSAIRSLNQGATNTNGSQVSFSIKSGSSYSDYDDDDISDPQRPGTPLSSAAHCGEYNYWSKGSSTAGISSLSLLPSSPQSSPFVSTGYPPTIPATSFNSLTIESPRSPDAHAFLASYK